MVGDVWEERALPKRRNKKEGDENRTIRGGCRGDGYNDDGGKSCVN